MLRDPIGEASRADPSEVSCEFVDCTILPEREMGALYQQVLTQDQPMVSGSSALLTTCERIEVYGVGDGTLDDLRHPHPDLSRRIEGEAVVGRRLAEIASGIRSQVLGEECVLRQVQGMLSIIPNHHPLSPLVRRAVDVARQVRGELRFNAVMDYPDLVLRVFDADEGRSAETVVVGSGLLAQGILRALLREPGQNLVAMTRSPKRLRKKLRELEGGSRVLCVTPHDALGRTMDDESFNFNLVVATSNVDLDYGEAIRQIGSMTGCHLAFDLCSVPILASTEGQTRISLYDDAVRSLISRQNNRLNPRVPHVREAIRESYSTE